MRTTNAICQRIGHRDSGQRHACGLPICATCRQPFDDDDGQPELILNTFTDPDGPAYCDRRTAERPAPEVTQSTVTEDVSPQELAVVQLYMSRLSRALGRRIAWSVAFVD